MAFASVRPAATAERRVSRESLRLTAPGHRTGSNLQPIHSTAIAVSVGSAIFRRSLQPAAANHTVCSQPTRACTITIRRSLRFSSTSTLSSVRGIPALAASRELRSLACGAPVLPTIRFRSRGCHVVPQVSFPALAATGRRFHTRPAAKGCQMGPSEGMTP